MYKVDGVIVSTIMINKGLGFCTVCEAANISSRTLSQIRRGTDMKYRINTIYRLATALGVEPFDIIAA